MSVQNQQLDAIYQLYQQQPADHVWIDVRQPEEWEEGTIPGTQRIMLSELPEELASLDPDKTYVMVCRSGGRSGRACQAMQEAGFDKLINFDGGMLAWYDAGHPLEQA